jgi:serine/threonine protein phosphatase 1
MASPLHVRLDLSSARRVLFGGDVHGTLDALLASLARVGYDAAAGDVLILLGDLFDRGPDVLRLIEWLEANPSVVVLRGNHDDMLAASVGARPMTNEANPYVMFNNGGEWLLDFAPDYGDSHEELGRLMSDLMERSDPDFDGDPSDLIDPRIVGFGRRIAALPVAATVITPGGLTIGAIHADPPSDTWAGVVEALEQDDPHMREAAERHSMWKRRLFNLTERASSFGKDAIRNLEIAIDDVDHVFMGHSIVERPRTAANITWIDTGAYHTGIHTVIDADRWVASLREAA